MDFRAVRDLYVGTARAYNSGDLVHESAVTGPDAWLVIGTDVEPLPGVRLDVPPRNASQALWAAFMTSAGTDADEAQGMSRQQLLDAYDTASAPPAADAPADVPADAGAAEPAATDAPDQGM